MQAEVVLDVGTDLLEASAALRSAADFYAQHKKPLEAIKRLDRGAQLPNQSLVNQIQFRLASAREALNLPNDTRRETVGRELAAIDQLMVTARSTSLSDAEAWSAESFAREAGRVRERLDLIADR